MTYQQFNSATPDAATQNITSFAASIRENLAAIRDYCVMSVPAGWSCTYSGGTAEKPATATMSRGDEQIRATNTWGTTGGAADNVTLIVYQYSPDNGSTWVDIGQLAINYDANSNCTSTVWTDA